MGWRSPVIGALSEQSEHEGMTLSTSSSSLFIYDRFISFMIALFIDILVWQ